MGPPAPAGAPGRDVLLATKLNVPGVRPDVVPRPRLARRLDEGRGRGLVLACAPAGYGKTVLLAEWARRGEHRVAWLSLDAGDDDPARFWRHAVAALDRVRPGISERMAPLLNPVPAQRARLLLAQGDLAAAARWTQDNGLDEDDEPDYASEQAHLVLARVLLAQARPGPALALLDRLHAAAAAQHRAGSLIEIGALRALALAASGDADRAVDALAGVLTLACPQGYVRIFADEGPPMAALLARLIAAQRSGHAAGVPLSCLARVQRAFDVGHARPGPRSGTAPAVVPGLVEQLTSRELEVLEMLAAGKPNQAIASELVVTLDTVKKHVSHVLGQARRGQPHRGRGPGAGTRAHPVATARWGQAPPAGSVRPLREAGAGPPSRSCAYAPHLDGHVEVPPGHSAVCGHAELGSVDARARAGIEPSRPHRGPLDRQGDRHGGIAHAQRAGQGRTVHAYGTERNDRVPIGVEEALRTDCAVPLPVPGAEARGVDLDVDARVGERLTDIDHPGPDREAAANRREPEQVPGRERDGRATRVDLVPARTGDRLRLGCADHGAGGAGLGLVRPESSHSFLR